MVSGDVGLALLAVRHSRRLNSSEPPTAPIISKINYKKHLVAHLPPRPVGGLDYTVKSSRPVAVKLRKVNQVDWFFIVPMIMNIPIGLCALYFIDVIGLKKSLWICTTCSTIGFSIRLSTLFHDGSNYDNCEKKINETDIDGYSQLHVGPKFSAAL